jgi:hypothetical protein
MIKNLALDQKIEVPFYPMRRARKKIKDRKCYDFNKHRDAWLIEGYAGMHMPWQTLSNNNPEWSAYRQKRLDTETNGWGFNAGARMAYLFNRNYLVRSGLHYEQIVQPFEHFDPNSMEITIRQRIETINGVQVTVTDTLDVRFGSDYLKTYNRFGMLDIPIEVGMELRSGHSGVNLMAGAAVNVFFWKRGAILSPDTDKPAYFTPRNGDIDVFRANLGLSIGASAQLFHHIKPKVRIFAEPYFRYIVQPVTVGTHPVRQHWGFGGVRVGLTRIL